MEKISDGDYKKAIGQLRLALNDVFQPFNIYGLNVLMPGAIDEIVELAEKFSMRTRKKDVAIALGIKRNHRG